MHLLHISGAYARHNNLHTTALRKRSLQSMDVLRSCMPVVPLQANAAEAIAVVPEYAASALGREPAPHL